MLGQIFRFQPGFTREQVKKALARAPDGSFILSQRPQDPDWKFHLSLKSGRHLNHFVVVNGSFGFTFKGVQLAFPTLSEFVAYYAKYESSLPERLWVTLELTEKSDQSGIPKSTGAVQSRATESSVVASVHQGTDAADLAPKGSAAFPYFVWDFGIKYKIVLNRKMFLKSAPITLDSVQLSHFASACGRPKIEVLRISVRNRY